MNSSADVLRILRALRRRLHATLFLDMLAASVLMVGAALVLFGVLNRWLFGEAPLHLRFLGYGAGIAFLLAIFATLARRHSLAEVAALLDIRGQTRDRFVSALAFSGENVSAGPMRDLAEHECADFLVSKDFRSLVPVRPPPMGAWVVVPFVAILFLQWDFVLNAARRWAETAEAQAAVADSLRSIEQIAKQAERASERTQDDGLKKLAEELKQSAERLRAETQRGDAQKSALRELSALEGMMKEMQRQPSPPAEMKELAKALAAAPGMKDVLDALEQGKLADAAKALEEAEKKMGEQPEPATEEQVQKALQQAGERLAQQRQLSEALQKLMDQARQQGGGQKSLTAEAMEQLRKMIEQMQKSGGAPRGGEQQQMTLQQLIAALQNLKFGDDQSPAGALSSSQQPGHGPPIAMQSPGTQNSDVQSPAGDAQQPSGRPGSEHDFGTTDTPFGAKNEAADKGAEAAVKGRLGEGESLSMMLPSADDTSKATRRYKELYEAMAPAAENAVEQDNIPLGSRFFIKRYFESIRPKE